MASASLNASSSIGDLTLVDSSLIIDLSSVTTDSPQIVVGGCVTVTNSTLTLDHVDTSVTGSEITVVSSNTTCPIVHEVEFSAILIRTTDGTEYSNAVCNMEQT